MLQATIAKRVDTLSYSGYILDTHHCTACFPPPRLSMLHEICNDIQLSKPQD